MKKIQFGFDTDNTIRAMKGLQLIIFQKEAKKIFFQNNIKSQDFLIEWA